MKKSEKAKLSRNAALIIERYHNDTKGGEKFLSEELKFAMLTQAMYFLMVNHEDADTIPIITKYTTALREAAAYLWSENAVTPG